MLYGKLRPYLQKALVPDFEGISATDLLPLKPNPEILDRRFLWRWLLSYDVLEYVMARQTGVKMPRLRTGDLETLPVPIPPLPEQNLIVEKIDRLFAESRTAREALESVPILLKHFRQSVLAKAFRGELTERDPNDEPASVLLERIRAERRRKWEENLRAKGKDPNKAKYIEPEPPDTSDLPELLEGWEWVDLGYVFDVSTGGTPSRKRPDYWNGNIPWVSSGEVAFCRIKDTREKITRTGLENSNAKLHPTGTILLAMIGEGKTRGQSAILEVAASNNQNVAAILCSETPIQPEYVFYWLMARYDETRGDGSGGAQPALNGARVKQIPLPVAPLAEQRRIVAKIGSLFAQAEAIEQAVAVARQRAEKVDQAILAKAFRGELVKMSEAAAVETALVIPSLTYSLLDLRYSVGTYIVSVMNDIKTFGRVQFQKALYLTETWVRLILQGSYQRAALGPFDDEMLSEIERTAQQAGWFFRHDRVETKGYYYTPGPAMNEQLQVAHSLLSGQKEKLDQLLKLLRKLNTKKAEMVATLFAAWNDFLLDGIQPTDEQIIREVRENWHEKKKRFLPEELRKMLKWMRDYQLTPTGFGPHTHKQK